MSEGPKAIVDWAVATLALEGEHESGDLHVVAPFDGGALVAAIDGLGHGPEAAAAARRAAEALVRHSGQPAIELFDRCHENLRGTRGAVITLASFNGASGTMSWAGVTLMSRPRKRIAPVRGGVSPEIERSVVVLPAPLEPISATTSPLSTLMVRPRSAWMRR